MVQKYPTLVFAIIIFSFLIEACGPSAAEIKNQEQQLIDSTQQATAQRDAQVADSIKKAKERQVRIELTQRQKAFLKNRLLTLDAQLTIEQAKLVDIEGFHLGRMPVDKANQINQQVAVINGIKFNMANINEMLQRIESGQDYKTSEALAGQ
jgi:hypothetical protein